jgi:hypothetical protein
MIHRMGYPLEPLPPSPPNERFVHLPDAARGMGIYCVAGRGSGKSRLLGRIIAAQDCWRGIPQVVWDAAGSLIDNFLDKIRRLPAARQAELWPRIRYVEMSGKFGVITPWPLYAPHPTDSLYETAQRYLEIIKRLDPDLTTASIEGWNALWEVGTHVGMALTALGGQITEAADLLAQPEVWLAPLQAAQAQYPELAHTLAFLRTLAEDKNADRRTKSFLNKTAVFRLDPSMTAMFGAASPGLDWETVVAQRETVLLDFRHELDSERRRLKMLWVFQTLLAFVKRRGAGRHRPIGLMIDELTTLFHFGTVDSSRLFTEDLDHLINVVARQYRVWLTLCHQELFQIDVKTRKTLMGMGTKIVGVTQDMEAALTLAQELLPYDPRRVKAYEPIFGGFDAELMDIQPIGWTLAEQQHLAAQLFTRLRPFHFVVKPAVGEGDVTGQLYPLSIAGVDQGIWIDEEAVGALRTQLRQAQGRPLVAELAAVAARRQHFLQPQTAPAAEPPPVAGDVAPPDSYLLGPGDVNDLAAFRESI